MTFATLITLIRIFMVPVFAILAIRYSESIQDSAPNDCIRWWAIGIFVTAAASDGIDGYVARHFNQCSKLGAFLDPIADKFLLLTAIITLTFYPWGNADWHIPLWFTSIVVARDVIILGGITILYYLKRHVPIKPSWVGKCSTVTQMALVAWVMIQITDFPLIYPALIAAFFTLWSGIRYVTQGFQIHFDAKI